MLSPPGFSCDILAELYHERKRLATKKRKRDRVKSFWRIRQQNNLTRSKQLLDVLGDEVYCDVLRVDLFTGMREGEVLGLQWSCVDFGRGTITIEKQLSRLQVKGEEYRFTSPKNDKPRTIQPAPFVMQLLKRQRRRQSEDRIRAGAAWDDDGFPDLVFTSETGKYLNYQIVLRHLKKAVEAAGLPEKRFHDLRHTYAVTSLQAGDDVKTVQENLGHHRFHS